MRGQYAPMASRVMGQGAQFGFLAPEHFYRASIWGELWPVPRRGWPGNFWRPLEKLTGSFHHWWILIFFPPGSAEDSPIPSFFFFWQTPSRTLTSENHRHIPRSNQGMEDTLKSAVTGNMCPLASLALSEYLFLARHKVCLAFTFQSSDTVPGMWFRQWGPDWWSALHSWGLEWLPSKNTLPEASLLHSIILIHVPNSWAWHMSRDSSHDRQLVFDSV